MRGTVSSGLVSTGSNWCNGVELESSLAALERLLQQPVTVVDNAHVFDLRPGGPCFTASRRSHRKHPACDAGFDERCIQHCRYAMNLRCLREETPFACGCWKGLTQIVAPLRDGGVGYGMLYVGLWRSPGVAAPPELPMWEEAVLPEIAPLLALAAEGIVAQLRREHKIDAPPECRGARIAAFFREHAAEPVTLPELAREIGLSPSRAGHVIRELFGAGFTELLLRERVERARLHLSATTLSLGEIAARCGFRDEFHLGRIFKQYVGISPGAYRRNQPKT